MPSADQVPVKSTHSTMRWPEWVVLIAGSTGSALRAFVNHAQDAQVGVGLDVVHFAGPPTELHLNGPAGAFAGQIYGLTGLQVSNLTIMSSI
jgi:hypothetical protein